MLQMERSLVALLCFDTWLLSTLIRMRAFESLALKDFWLVHFLPASDVISGLGQAPLQSAVCNIDVHHRKKQRDRERDTGRGSEAVIERSCNLSIYWPKPKCHPEERLGNSITSPTPPPPCGHCRLWPVAFFFYYYQNALFIFA